MFSAIVSIFPTFKIEISSKLPQNKKTFEQEKQDPKT